MKVKKVDFPTLFENYLLSAVPLRSPFIARYPMNFNLIDTNSIFLESKRTYLSNDMQFYVSWIKFSRDFCQ